MDIRLVVIFSICCVIFGYFIADTIHHRAFIKKLHNTEFEYCGVVDGVSEIKKLELLYDLAMDIKMDSWGKEKLIKEITYEIDYQKKKLYEKIGEEFVKKSNENSKPKDAEGI